MSEDGSEPPLSGDAAVPAATPAAAAAAPAAKPRGRASAPLVVCDGSLPAALAGFPSATADRYLEGDDAGTLDDGRWVVNLCRSYSYLSKGYYVSLVADARRQRALPPLEAVEGTNNPFIYFRTLAETGIKTVDYRVQPGRRRVVPRSIALGDSGERSATLVGRDEGGKVRFEKVRLERGNGGGERWVDVVSAFGFTPDRRFQRHSAAIYRVYAFPLLRVRMYDTEDGWRVGQLQPVPLAQATPDEVALLAGRLARGPSALAATAPPPPRLHRLAVLFDPADPTSPSDEETIDKLARVASRRGLLVERLGKGDLGRLAEYDALFIRTVTAIDNASFTFSQTADGLGMPVIDDPGSIVRCSNKIFLYELFRKQGLPMPDTAVISPRNWREEVRPLGLPLILKVPDGTFSLAVKRADDEAQLEALVKEMFKRTPLLLAQRFTPSEFDWRVGILERRILWTARYHMAAGHWQIAHRSAAGTRYGRVDAVPIADCPREVTELALAGAALIGDGLYGVDIKMTDTGPVLIEINDNPNLEAGVEDGAEKDRPYEAIVDCFLRRIEAEGRAERRDDAAGGGA